MKIREGKPNRIEREMDNSTGRVGNFNIPCSIMDQIMRQKITKKQKNKQHYKPSDLTYL